MVAALLQAHFAASGDGQAALDLLHLHQAVLVQVLVDLGLAGAGSVGTQQRVGLLALVVDNQVGGAIGRHRGYRQGPGMFDVQRAEVVVMGGQGAGTAQQGPQGQQCLAHV
ncbi:hypothetical protein D9M71_832450 [compost metagenome]